jgi:hypothetical protein
MVFLMAACAGPPDNSPKGVCSRKAEDDPQVKQLIMLSGTNTILEMELRSQLRNARNAVTNQCLQSMGIELRGGVQAETPSLPR